MKKITKLFQNMFPVIAAMMFFTTGNVLAQTPFQVWNWADLAYLNVLMEDYSANGEYSDWVDLYDRQAILMQDLGVPGQGNSGNGTGCPYTDGERMYGYYGYQNYLTEAAYLATPAATAIQPPNTLKVGNFGAFVDEVFRNDQSGWIPIGCQDGILSTVFSGEFNGNGKTINGLWIDRLVWAPQGLFGVLSRAYIHDFTVVIASHGIIGYSEVGGIAGRIEQFTPNIPWPYGGMNGVTTLQNLTVSAEAGGSIKSVAGDVGGIYGTGAVAYVRFLDFIENNANVYATGYLAQNAGGIAGRTSVFDGHDISNGRPIDGVIGFTDAILINNGEIHGKSEVGGIFGSFSSEDIHICISMKGVEVPSYDVWSHRWDWFYPNPDYNRAEFGYCLCNGVPHSYYNILAVSNNGNVFGTRENIGGFIGSFLSYSSGNNKMFVSLNNRVCVTREDDEYDNTYVGTGAMGGAIGSIFGAPDGPDYTHFYLGNSGIVNNTSLLSSGDMTGGGVGYVEDYGDDCNISVEVNRGKVIGGGTTGGCIGWIQGSATKHLEVNNLLNPYLFDIGMPLPLHEQIIEGGTVGGVVGVANNNVTIISVSVDAPNLSGSVVGGVVGKAYNSILQGCLFENLVIENNPYIVGGVVGVAHNSILEDCTYLGNMDIYESKSVGGLVGVGSGNNTFRNCRVQGVRGLFDSPLECTPGAITVEHGFADFSIGGFIGRGSGNFLNCYANIHITAPGGYDDNGAGGFAGVIEKDAGFTNCHANGSITVAASNVGGFVGKIAGNNVLIENCYAKGNITNADEAIMYQSVYSVEFEYIGGFAGRIDSAAEIRNCYATGSVKGHQHTGGFLGGTYGNFSRIIENCFSSGTVTGASHGIGGFAGSLNTGTTVRDCYSFCPGILANNALSDRGRFCGNTGQNPTLTNNYALKCMPQPSRFGSPYTPTPNCNGYDGGNITFEQATDPSHLFYTYNTPTWDFSTNWTFDYHNPTKYLAVTPETNLPILQAFQLCRDSIGVSASDICGSNHIELFSCAEQPPKTSCNTIYAQVLTCYPVNTLDVLANLPTLPSCPTILTAATLSAKGATVTVENDKLIYTLPPTFKQPEFTGIVDTVQCVVQCSGNEEEYIGNDLVITVALCPDNIDTVECVRDVSATVWGIKVAKETPVEVSSLIIPFVGDLNDDGMPEIVCFASEGTINDNGKRVNRLFIYDGATLAKIRTIILPSYVSAFDAAPYGLVKLPDRKGLIVVATVDYKLRAYDYNGTLVWTSTEVYGSGASNSPDAQLGVNIGFADFNGDGYPEIYIRNKIYDAETGRLLGTASGGSNTGSTWAHTTSKTPWQLSAPIAVDVLGEGKPQLILGNEIYRVNISDRNITTNAITLAKTIVPPASVPADGHAQVADFDNDGRLDILITNKTDDNTGRAYAYVWDIYHNTVSTPLTIPVTGKGKSIPLISNVDNDPDGILEFVIQVNISGDPKKIRCYRYNPSTKDFTFLWGYAPDEDSWSNGVTLFDFNLDGSNEILMSDQSSIRILNGTTGATITSFAYGETTVMQYPVIADVDGDGSADIVVIGKAGAAGMSTDYGSLNILKSSGSLWVSARKVWNQYMYNTLNINEDLTVPSYAMNPATLFPNGKRPYNNFLQQQTMIDQNGNPFMPMPKIIWHTPPTLALHGDTVTITGCIKNVGFSALHTPIYFTYYRNDTLAANRPGNIIMVDSIHKTLMPDSTYCFTRTVKDLGAYAPISKFWISVNDSAGKYPYQSQCILDGRRGFDLFVKEIPNLNHEVVTCWNTDTIDIIRHMLDWNTVLLCNREDLSVKIYPPTTPKGITPVVDANKNIVYTHNGRGCDTLNYAIICADTIYGGKLCILVTECPDNVDSLDCTLPFTPIPFTIKQQLSMVAGDNVSATGILVGDLDGDNLPEIVAYYGTVTTNCPELRVMNAQTGAIKATLAIPNAYASGGWYPTMSAVLVDADNNGMGEIILATNDGNINSYEAQVTAGVFSLVKKWGPVAFTAPSGIAAIDRSPQPIVADFNGDGIPEVVVWNQIFNAATGALLGVTEPIATAHVGRNPIYAQNKGTNFMTVADFDDDGLPEIVAGGKVYKVNINSAGTVATCSILYQNTTLPDGFTAVADIDMDGLLDVVVTYNPTTASNGLYVWTPQKSMLPDGGIIDQFTIGSSYAHGYPFIGDIDGFVDPTTGKKHPEICLTNANRVYAYRYVGTTKKLTQKWSLTTTDNSGGTGITLFDFNNDGIKELVYRDETQVRILNGSANSTPVLAAPGASFACTSGTAWEYPVIADTDGDGSANICVTCGNHNVRIFESAGTPWAPTRPVWNQVNYEPLYIRDNLTVPERPALKNISANGTYMYNGALIQVSIVDQQWQVAIPTSDAAVTNLWVEPHGSDSAYIKITVCNLGGKNTNMSLPVALYRNATYTAPVFKTKPVGVVLTKGACTTVSFGVKVSELGQALSVRVQDNGTEFPAIGFSDCDLTNNYRALSGKTLQPQIAEVVTCWETDTIDIISKVLAVDATVHCSRADLVLTVHPPTVPKGVIPVVNANKNIIYAHNGIGRDTLNYAIICADTIYGGKLCITVTKCPDNVDTVECWGLPSPFEWTIKEAWRSTNDDSHNYSIPFVGDIDNDGIPEIITLTRVTGDISTFSPGFKIFLGKDRANGIKEPKTILVTNGIRRSVSDSRSVCPYAICKAEVNGIVRNIIILIDNTNQYLYAYDLNAAIVTNDQRGLWLWRTLLDAELQSKDLAINIADFDNCGNPEIYIGNRIYDVATGRLLVRGNIIDGTNNMGARTASSVLFPIAADMNNDGKLDLVCGTRVYGVNIPNKTATAPAGNSLTLIKQLTGQTFNAITEAIDDAASIVADINQDGKLDIINWRQSTITSPNRYVKIMAWDFEGDTLLCAYEFTNGNNTRMGVPMIGNIDNDPGLEIVFTRGNKGDPAVRLSALKPNFATKQFTLAYELASSFSDESIETGMTLFDFNQDNQNEIVYRDEQNLRILHSKASTTPGGVGTFTTLFQKACTSTTANEYPVIADVDNDGAAEIVVVGNTSGYVGNGYLWIFKSGNEHPWAPARKVWNQYAYNVVNINEDLTVPRYPMNPAKFFPNGKQPFNNFLQQQTTINSYGEPYFPMPNIVWTTEPTGAGKNTIVVSGCFTNKGAAALQTPIYVTFYANDTIADGAHIMAVDSINTLLLPGDTVCFTLNLNNVNLWKPDSIWMSINDRGTGKYPYQDQCEIDGRRVIKTDPCPTIAIHSIYATHPSCGIDNGSIEFQVSGGTDYEYRINGGAYQLYTDGLLLGLGAGVYVIQVRDTAYRMCEPAKYEMKLESKNSDLKLYASAIHTNTCLESDLSGAIYAVASGGTPPYTYSLEKIVSGVPVEITPFLMENDTIKNLNSGEYVVTVTDGAGCQALTYPPVELVAKDATLALTLLNVYPAACNADTGRVIFTIESNSPYRYRLNGQAEEGPFPATSTKDTIELTGLNGGSHLVSAVNACGAKDTLRFMVDLEDVGALSVAATPTSVKKYCEDNFALGNIYIAVSGGTAPYRYSYDEGATWVVFYGLDTTIYNLHDGKYDITVIDDDNCRFEFNEVVIAIEYVAPVSLKTIYAGNHPTACGLCDGTIVFVPEGGSGVYEYTVTPAPAFLTPPTIYAPYTDGIISNLCAGSYTVSLRDTLYRTCPVATNKPIELSDSSNLFISLVALPATDCSSGDGALMVMTTGGTPAFTYTLYNAPIAEGDPGTPVTLIGNKIPNLQAHDYIVKVTDFAGCTAFSEVTTVEATLSDLSITPVSTKPTPCEAEEGIATVAITSSTDYTYKIDDEPEKERITAVLVTDHISFTDLKAGSHTITVWTACATRTLTVTIENTLGGLTASAIATNVTKYCDGTSTPGSITLTANGAAPYRCTFDKGVTWTYFPGPSIVIPNLPNGKYDITVEDNTGCTFDVNDITITTEKAKPVSIGSIYVNNHPTCGNTDGDIQFYVSGGSGKYEYRVNGGAYQLYTDGLIPTLGAGTYYVEVQDTLYRSCANPVSATIVLRNQSSDLTVKVTPTDATDCTLANGKLTLTITGGSLTYTHYRLNGVLLSPLDREYLNLAPGAYVVTVTDDNGCTASSDVVRIKGANSGLNIAVLETVNTVCGAATGAVRIATAGTAPYRYQLDYEAEEGPLTGNDTLVFTELSAGEHQLRIFNTCGEETGYFTITNGTTGLSFTAIPTDVKESCGTVTLGQIAITVSNGAPGYKYRYNGGVWTSFAGAALTLSNLTEGVYKVELMDNAGCTYEVRKEIKRWIDVCKILDCSTFTDKYVAEDGYGLGYLHTTTDWDVDPATMLTIDSVQYFINGTLYSSGTSASLAGSHFTVGVSTVRVIGYKSDLADTCEFKVYVDPACPSDVLDVDGAILYKVTKLAGLCWTENLRAVHYFNGSDIAYAKPYTCPTCPARLDTIFGLLYTWYSAVNLPEGSTATLTGNVQGICPDGFHIPTQAEWTLLSAYPSSQLQSTRYWLDPPGSGTDNYGFDARPAGWYNSASNRFEDLYGYTGWWASDNNSGTTTASYFEIAYYCATPQIKSKVCTDALSVRCVMD